MWSLSQQREKITQKRELTSPLTSLHHECVLRLTSSTIVLKRRRNLSWWYSQPHKLTQSHWSPSWPLWPYLITVSELHVFLVEWKALIVYICGSPREKSNIFRLGQKWVHCANQVLGLSPIRVQVPVLFVASTSSYAHESTSTSRHYIQCTRSTVDFR